MIERFRNRWKRKGSLRRGVEMVVMSIAWSLSYWVLTKLGIESTEAKGVASTAVAYVSKLAFPTEPEA